MADEPKNTISVNMDIHPTDGTFTMGYQFDFGSPDMPDEIRVHYMRIMYGMLYMLAHKPTDFVEYAQRVESALEIQSTIADMDDAEDAAEEADAEAAFEAAGNVTHFPARGRDN